MIELFRKITEGNTTTKTLKTKIKESWCIKMLKALERDDLVIIQNGRPHKISLSSSAQAKKLKELLSRDPSIDFGDLLDKNKGRILQSVLYTAKTAKEIAKQLKINQRTVRRMVAKNLNRGLLIKRDRKVIFHKAFWPYLFQFLDAYRNRANVEGALLWQFEEEVLFEARMKGEGTLTGFSKYDDYGVHVLESTYCYFFPKKKLSKEEIFIHSLLQIEKDPRVVGLAAVFYIKNKLSRKKIRELAVMYDCVKKAEELLVVIKGNLNTKELPIISSGNLQRIYGIYGVKQNVHKRKHH